MLDIVLIPTIIVVALIIFGFVTKSQLEEMVIDYINDMKGEIIEVAPKLMENFADTILTKFKSSIMGMKSGKVRAEKAATGKLISEVIQSKNPLVGMFVERIPELKDMLQENPEALVQLLSLAQGFIGGGSQSIGSSVINSSTPASLSNNPYWRCV